MKDFMKTITSAIKCWTTAKIKNSTADWNEKDVNKDSYIKNKPDVVLRKEVDAIQNAIDYKMNNSNPVGTGSFSMNRLPNSEIGDLSHAEGCDTIASGNTSHAEGYSTEASGDTSHAEGYSTEASGDTSHAEGYSTEASGYSSHAEGYYTKASDHSSHAEGNYTEASGGSSHAEGYSTVASGDTSHAEGYGTVASGDTSHAEGYYTKASGDYSHAEGNYTKASGGSSHAEGHDTVASGGSSHAEGYYTKASGDYQHVQGKYNIDDVDAEGNPLNNYAHIVGNGTSNSSRSNAHTLDWEGNAWYQGDVYIGSTSGTNRDEGSKKLASEEYVDNAVANAGGGVQSDWNQNDETASDYVKNRTHWVEEARPSVAWDGNTADKICVADLLYLIDSTVYKIEDFIDAVFFANDGSNLLFSSDVVNLWVEEGKITDEYIVSEFFLIALKDNVEFGGVVFPQAGIYSFKVDGQRFITEIRFPEKIHKIPEKYLPEVGKENLSDYVIKLPSTDSMMEVTVNEKLFTMSNYELLKKVVVEFTNEFNQPRIRPIQELTYDNTCIDLIYSNDFFIRLFTENKTAMNFSI